MTDWTGVYVADELIATFRYGDQAHKWANAAGNYKGRAQFKLVTGPTCEEGEEKVKSTLDQCPKCGGVFGLSQMHMDTVGDPEVRYSQESKCLLRSCPRCQYGWQEPSLDASDAS